MVYPISALKEILDDIYPPTGTTAHIALLDDVLAAVNYTVNPSTNVLTTASAHGLVTGARVRSLAAISQPSIAPSGTLSGTVDYYVGVETTTTLKLYRTQADAIAATNAIDFIDSGNGTLSLTEQLLLPSDPLAVLVSHELDHPNYSRTVVEDIGAAVDGEGRAEKPPVLSVLSPIGTNMVFRHLLVITGGSETIGSTTGQVKLLYSLPAAITVLPGFPQVFVLKFAAQSAA